MRKEIILSLLTFCILLTACQSSSGQHIVVQTTYTEAYKTNQTTILYADFDVDSAQIATLSVGTHLTPADGRETLFCDSIVEAGMTYNLCKVQVFLTRKTGWVLRQSLDE